MKNKFIKIILICISTMFFLACDVEQLSDNNIEGHWRLKSRVYANAPQNNLTVIDNCNYYILIFKRYETKTFLDRNCDGEFDVITKGGQPNIWDFESDGTPAVGDDEVAYQEIRPSDDTEIIYGNLEGNESLYFGGTLISVDSDELVIGDESQGIFITYERIKI